MKKNHLIYLNINASNIIKRSRTRANATNSINFCFCADDIRILFALRDEFLYKKDFIVRWQVDNLRFPHLHLRKLHKHSCRIYLHISFIC